MTGWSAATVLYNSMSVSLDCLVDCLMCGAGAEYRVPQAVGADCEHLVPVLHTFQGPFERVRAQRMHARLMQRHRKHCADASVDPVCVHLVRRRAPEVRACAGEACGCLGNSGC